jgi:hypothetical protein
MAGGSARGRDVAVDGVVSGTMSAMSLRRGFLVAASAGSLLAAVLGIGQEPPEKPPCARATVALVDEIHTAHARPGDTFRLRTTDPVTLADGTVVPADAPGYGVVSIAQHAQRGGRGGYVAIEARFVALPNGTHVPTTIDWAAASNATATGGSRNIPGFVGAVPFAGYVLGPYAMLHHGSDIAIAKDTRIPVLLGDDVAMGTCRARPASSPSPLGTASETPLGSSVPIASPAPLAPASPSPMPSPRGAR